MYYLLLTVMSRLRTSQQYYY